MKRGVSLPQHDMPEPVTAHFEVNTKIVHNFDVISEVLRCGEVGEPAALMTFREVDPPTPWSRCSHESRGVFGGRVRVTGARGRREQDVRQVQADPPRLCRENKRGRDRSICIACIESAPRQQRQRQTVQWTSSRRDRCGKQPAVLHTWNGFQQQEGDNH